MRSVETSSLTERDTTGARPDGAASRCAVYQDRTARRADGASRLGSGQCHTPSRGPLSGWVGGGRRVNGSVLAVVFSDEERQVEGLAPVEARVARGLIA